ncbi:MAG: hypothetical protein OIF58_15700 [Cohaesibacter sp.]|nr:hypothetical protein [Cohaesibacter sp.]
MLDNHNALKVIRFIENERKNGVGLRKFEIAMKDNFTKRKGRAPKAVSYHTLGNLLKVDTEDGSLLKLDSVKRVYRFLQQRNFLPLSDPGDPLGRATEFFETINPDYNKDHLEQMCGQYHMYRRFWLENNNSMFMRSFLTIYPNDLIGAYRIREYQCWKDYKYIETSTGFLFPSGKSVLAVCNSKGRTTVKFLALSKLDPHSANTPIQSFSGNGIASSDKPPHTGFGFHCRRIPKVEEPRNSEDMDSMQITFEEMKAEKLDILKEIIYYENYANVDFLPRKELYELIQTNNF